MTIKHKKLTDPSNNRRKVIMYGCVRTAPDGRTVKINALREKRSEAVKVANRYSNFTKGTCGICKVEMLMPSEKNQWTITVDECVEVTPSSKEKADGKVLQHVRTRKFTIETVNRPIVWGTKKLTDEAVQAYIEAYIGNDPKEIENFKECNGTLNLFSNPRSPQIN